MNQARHAFPHQGFVHSQVHFSFFLGKMEAVIYHRVVGGEKTLENIGSAEIAVCRPTI